MKSVQIRRFLWFVFSSIQTEYGKMQTRKNSAFGHFSRSDLKKKYFQNIGQKIILYHKQKRIQESDKIPYRPISLLSYLTKFLDLYFILCLIILDKTNFLQSLSLVFFRKTPAFLNYYQLLIKFTRVLIVGQQQILEWFSSIFQKRLMSFGIMVYFSNLSP